MFIPHQKAHRIGAVAMLVAISLTAILGITAIVLDGGLLQDQRRRVQGGADATALGAAKDLFETYINMDAYDNGKDPTNTAYNHALAIAAGNGYLNDGTESIVTVNIPPKSGPYTNKLGHVEVIIEYRQRRYFSSIFGSEDMPVRARAVARGTYEPKAVGILVLDPVARGALTLSGQSLGIVTGADVIVNSNHANAGVGEGSTTKLTAENFQFTGGVNTLAPFDGKVYVGYAPTPDPYRDVIPPDPASMPLRTVAEATVVDHGSGYKTYYLEPGRYVGGLFFDGKSSVRMAPGVYYMEGNSQGGGFKFQGNSATTLVADGVMLYNDRGSNTVTNTGSTAYPQISISGQASVTWTPPTSGPYKNFTFFQARGQDPTVYVAGGGAMNIKGIYYTTGALLDIAGSGDNKIGSQLVGRFVTLRGNGTFRVDYDADKVPPVRSWKLVE
jgi:hypothetical protein